MSAKKNERLSVRDEDSTLRTIFARIGAQVATGGDMTAGVRYAASFTDGALRRQAPPPDWNKCSLAELRDYAVYGYSFYVRAEAVKRLEEKVKELAFETIKVYPPMERVR